MVATFKVDASAVIRALRNFRVESAPMVLAYAMTKTSQDIKAEEISLMQSVFDRPTRYTLNALRLKPATKTDLQAVVDFKDFGGTPAWKYLGPNVQGGPRRKKSHELALQRAGILDADEYCVPGRGVKLDASGNMRGSLISQILSQVKASSDPMQNQTDRSTKRRSRRGGASYFVLRGSTAPDGIYWRKPGAKFIRPIIMFVVPPRYRKLFPFYERARATFEQRLTPRAIEAWQRFGPKT
jgi:hypothetical protein